MEGCNLKQDDKEQKDGQKTIYENVGQGRRCDFDCGKNCTF